MRSRKKVISTGLVSVMLAIMLSGCWDRLEIEDRAVILALAIDQVSGQGPEDEVTHLKQSFTVPSKQLIRITAQLAVPGRIPLGPQTGGGSSGGQQKPVWVLSVDGHTLDDAIMNLQQQVADRLFFGHLRIIVVGESLARKGVDNINDYFRRNSEIRRSAWMMVSKGSAGRLMRITPELERVPALYLVATMDHAVEMGKFPNDFLGIFWSAMSSRGQDSYLPYIELKRGQNIEIAGMAYFRESRMVGTTKPLEIGEFMAIKGITRGGYAVFTKMPGSSGVVMFHSTRRKSRTRVEIRNGRPFFTVKIRIEGNLGEKSNENFQLKDQRAISQIEQQLADEATAGFEKLIKKTQSKQSDIFGFGEYVRAKCWRYWNQNIRTEKAWAEIYKDVTFDVQTTIKIRRVGMKST